MPSLTALRVPMDGASGTLMSAVEARQLLQALPPSMRELNVLGHFESTTDDWLDDLTWRCPGITALDVSLCTRLCEVGHSLRRLSQLTTLRMYDCICVRCEALEEIGGLAPLETLDVGRTKAKLGLLLALAGGRAAPTLTALSMRACLLDDAAIGAIGSLGTLVALDLSQLSENSSASSLALVGALAQLRQLCRLAIDAALLDPVEHTLRALATHDHLCERLQALTIRGCGVGAEHLALLTPLRALHTLELGGDHHPFSEHSDALSAATALAALTEAQRALLTRAPWWRDEWLATRRYRAAEVLLALRELPMWDARDAQRVPSPGGLSARLDASIAALASCTGAEADAAARSLGLNSSLSRQALLCCLETRAEQVARPAAHASGGRLMTTPARIWCSHMGQFLDAACREHIWTRCGVGGRDGVRPHLDAAPREVVSRVHDALDRMNALCANAAWLDASDRAEPIRLGKAHLKYLERVCAQEARRAAQAAEAEEEETDAEVDIDLSAFDL